MARSEPWYGSFGQVSYDADTTSWNFVRDHESHTYLRPINFEDPANAFHTATPPLETRTRTIRHKRQIDSLLQAYPELEPARTLLPDLLRSSEAVIAGQHNPFQGQQLDAAYIGDRGRHARSTIIAWVSGDSRSNVTVVPLVEQTFTFSTTAIRAHSLHESRSCTIACAAPVEQVCLLHETFSLLSIRTQTKTQIYRIVLGSVLECHLLHEVQLEDTGDNVHSHMSFCQFDARKTRQFGVVDSTGVVRVWAFQDQYLQECDQIFEGVKHDMVSLDGWYRTLWVTNSSTLALASRQGVVLCNTASPMGDLTRIKLDSDLGSSMVLDIEMIATRPDWLFVLTSTQVSIVSVKQISKNDEISCCAKLIWRALHYGNPGDLTLSMHVAKMNHDLLLTVQSGMVAFSIAYQLSLQGDDASCVAGPFSFDQGLLRERTCLAMQLLPTKVLHQDPPDLDADSDGDERQILQLFLNHNGCVKQEFYCLLADREPYSGPEILGQVNEPRRSTKLPEWVDHGEDKVRKQKEPLSSFSKSRMAYLKAQQKHQQPPLDFSDMRAAIARPRQDSLQDMQEILAAVRHAKNGPRNDAAIELASFASGKATLGDVDRTAAALDRLQLMSGTSAEDSDHNLPTTIVESLALPDNGAAIIGNPSPATLYDSLVSDWLDPLSPDIPGEVRLAKDDLIRHVAAEVSLACNMLRTRTAEPEGDSQDNPSQSAAVSGITSTTRTSSIYAIPRYILPDYIQCTRALPTSLPRPWRRVLSHWDIGADPETYDWRTRSRNVRRQAEEEDRDADRTDKDRAKAQRAAERHLRRQRKEAVESQKIHQAPVPIISASQPMPDRTKGSLFSQGPLAASQAVPGRHGGKPVKKKRKQGF